jgi:hypothetical protein
LVEELVSKGIRDELERVALGGSELVGISCLADGADQIFATIVIEHGARLEVVVPAEEYRDALPESAKMQYDKLLSHASCVHRCPYRESNAEAHMAASRLMVDSADRLIAVWDGQPARSFGGTADVVAYAQKKRLPVAVIWPAGASRD